MKRDKQMITVFYLLNGGMLNLTRINMKTGNLKEKGCIPNFALPTGGLNENCKKMTKHQTHTYTIHTSFN